MNSWSRALGATNQLIVNNDSSSVQPDELAGSNASYEFSGYLEGLKAMPKDWGGPFLIVNDTLLANHWAFGWRILLKKVLKANESLPLGAVYSDWRPAIPGIKELEQPFFASWIFWCTDVSAINRLKSQLQLLLNVDLPPMTEAYAHYIGKWLSGGSRWRGWHQTLSKSNLMRKERCIRMEHRLSQLLVQQGLTLSFGHPFPKQYMLIRWVDRGRTLVRRLLPSRKV